jgi:hypothetical protein
VKFEVIKKMAFKNANDHILKSHNISGNSSLLKTCFSLLLYTITIQIKKHQIIKSILKKSQRNLNKDVIDQIQLMK